jgi:hypothetical protein
MPAIRTILLLSLILSWGLLFGCRKTEWTKKEVVDWYSHLQSGTHSQLHYQGSDEKRHYFAMRSMDEWVFIRIHRGELTLPEEHPHASNSGGQFSFYDVNPARDFARVEEQKQPNKGGPANGSQPIRSETNRTSSAAGSRR